MRTMANGGHAVSGDAFSAFLEGRPSLSGAGCVRGRGCYRGASDVDVFAVLSGYA